jgi:4a-hydroxytetrahydrobiopterin dehydratase
MILAGKSAVATRHPGGGKKRSQQTGLPSANPAPQSSAELPITHPMSDLLEDDDLTAALKKCPEWEYEKKAITRTIEFEEFNDAIDFVNDLAEIAEEAQHHPDITIRHTKVTLKLTTHDAGGVTNLDIELAQRVDNLVD